MLFLTATVKPGQDVSWAGRSYVNATDRDLFLVEPRWTAAQVREEFAAQLPFYPDARAATGQAIEECKAAGGKGNVGKAGDATLACIKRRTLLQRKNDPFDIQEQLKKLPRYVATLVAYYYPPGETFHLRGLHYRLVERNTAWPASGSKLVRYEGKQWKGNRAVETQWKDLGDALASATYAGLIQPRERVLDNRVTTGIQPANADVVPQLRQQKFTPSLTRAEIRVTGNFDVELQVPLVLLYGEKGELQPTFERFAAEYYCAYYVAQGDASIPATRDIYNYIKARSRVGVILCFTDFDPPGARMPVTFARKIQYWAEIDRDPGKPGIFIVPAAITGEQAAQLRELERARGITLSLCKAFAKGKPPLETYELSALEALASSRGTSFYEMLRGIVAGAVAGDTLVPRADVASLKEREETRLKGDIFARVQDIFGSDAARLAAARAQIPRLEFDVSDLDALTRAIDEHVTQLEAYRVLQEATAGMEFDPEDVERALQLGDAARASAIATPELLADYRALTQELIAAKKARKEGFAACTPGQAEASAAITRAEMPREARAAKMAARKKPRKKPAKKAAIRSP